MKNVKSLQILSLFALVAVSGCAQPAKSNSTASSLSSEATSSLPESQSSSVSSSSVDSEVPAGYTLDWSDEFDGDQLDTSNWTPLIGNGSGGWGNNELEYYQSQNATVADGQLTITGKKESVGNCSYTSARLVTARKESTTYGYIQARISLPAQNAMWPAFWMLPENGSWPMGGEIDIMENKGSSPWTTSGALHHSGTSSSADSYEYGSHSFSQRKGESNITAWHTYAVLWEEEEITWYVDGVSFLNVPKRSWHPANGTIYTSNDNAPFNKPFHLLLNLAIGGNFDSEHTAPDADFESAEMKVDYVRVYTEG
jgi:beta-glucanase (GH16 family)